MTKNHLTILTSDGRQIEAITYMSDDEIFREIVDAVAEGTTPRDKCREQFCLFRVIDPEGVSGIFGTLRHNIGSFMLRPHIDHEAAQRAARANIDAQGRIVQPLKKV
jgi:hypothetical protein